MKLVIDLVVNHTSDEHPWFVESRSSLDSPKRDWYWWRSEVPNEWRSFFSGPAWELDPTTGEHYLHLFSRKQPDLNWENPEVREAIYSMMRWWLDRGVDGFRMDVVNLISKDLTHGIYFNGPRIHEFLHEMHRAVFEGRDGLLAVGEMPNVSLEQARLYTDPARREVDMVFQFEHVSLDQGPASKWDIKPLQLLDLKRSLGRWQEGLADVGWNSLYWDNHDQPRAVSRFGDDGEHRVAAAKMLATVLHLHRGTPYVYQGEELGMTNAPFNVIEDFRDIESLNHYAEAVALGASPDDVLLALRKMGRDNARTPMQWDAGRHAGFTSGEPWIPVNPNHSEINAASSVADPDSVFHHYRRVIELRHSLPVIARGDFTMRLQDDERVYAFTRALDGDELLVLGNFTGDSVVLEIDGWTGAEEALIGTPGLALGPWEGKAFRRRGPRRDRFA